MQCNMESMLKFRGPLSLCCPAGTQMSCYIDIVAYSNRQVPCHKNKAVQLLLMTAHIPRGLQ